MEKKIESNFFYFILDLIWKLYLGVSFNIEHEL